MISTSKYKQLGSCLGTYTYITSVECYMRLSSTHNDHCGIMPASDASRGYYLPFVGRSSTTGSISNMYPDFYRVGLGVARRHADPSRCLL